MQRKFGDYLFRSNRKRRAVNRLMCALLVLASLAAVVPLFLVFGYALSRGLPALSFAFFTDLPKPVGEAGGGMGNALLGTITLVLVAGAIGVPWGVGIGLWLSEFGQRSRLAGLIRFSADMLASVPSIVIGLFAYAVLVVPMKRFSALSGGVALALIMVPTISRTTEELLKLVPVHIREAGLALGLPRWKVILWIVLKGSRGPVITGVMLALARAAGETAPLLFTAFNNHFWQQGLDQPIASLPVQIYTYAVSPFEEWHRQAWAGASLLVLLVFALNLATRFTLGRVASARDTA